MAPQGSEHQNLNQMANPTIQDSSSITIEFLRARLLAERTVSKSAREKVNELATKVAELEEHLKIVSLQRKKAEKATADVLAILEENGFTDHSDTYDSSSDNETYSDKNSMEMAETSVNSKVRNNNDMNEEHSHSELRSLTANGRNISWKGCKSEASSSDKLKESRMIRQKSLESVHLSSTKNRHGKSCRQIRHKELRFMGEGSSKNAKMVESEESRVNNSEILDRTTREEDKPLNNHDLSKGDENLPRITDSDYIMNEKITDLSLERALENHAQVIGCFEDMEKTQREWEEKFRETNICALDLCDPGNHSDVTDDGNDPKTHHVHDQSMIIKTPSQSLQDEHIPEPSKSDDHRLQSFSNVFFEHSLSHPNLRSSSHCKSSTVSGTASNCDTVLTALRQAKLSLQERANTTHLPKPKYVPEGLCSMAPSPKPVFTTKVTCMGEVPVDCAGLFRVPSDLSSKNNIFLPSSSRDNLIRYKPERGIPPFSLCDTSAPVTVTERLPTTPYITRSKLWTDFAGEDQHFRHYKETSNVLDIHITSATSSSGASPNSLSLDRRPAMDTGTLSLHLPWNSSRYSYPDPMQFGKERF